MNALKKTSVALLAFAISASAFAASDLETRVQELEKKMDTISTVTPEGLLGLRPAPARAEPNGNGWFLSVDALYWQTKVDGIQYATTNDQVSEEFVHRNGTVREPTFDWAFGVKAGIGYNFFYDGWEMNAEYTYFQNKGSDRYHVAPPSGIYPIDESLLALSASDPHALLDHEIAEFATSSVSDVEVTLNNLVYVIGKDFYVSKKLSVRPNVGLQAAWISRSQDSRYFAGGTYFTHTYPSGHTVDVGGLGSDTLYVSKENKTTGLGPTVGIDTLWYLGNRFSFYTNMRGSLLFGYIRYTDHDTFSGSQNAYLTRTSIHRIIPTGDIALGLCYDKYIMDETQHIHFALGYEIQQFWSDNIGNVGFYGVDFNIRWDF